MKIIVDNDLVLDGKSALPFPNSSNSASKIIELSSSQMKEKIEGFLEEMSETLSGVELNNSNKCKIKEAKFNLSFSSSGEIGLFSIAKAGISGNAGIEFTITFE